MDMALLCLEYASAQEKSHKWRTQNTVKHNESVACCSEMSYMLYNRTNGNAGHTCGHGVANAPHMVEKSWTFKFSHWAQCMHTCIAIFKKKSWKIKLMLIKWKPQQHKDAKALHKQENLGRRYTMPFVTNMHVIPHRGALGNRFKLFWRWAVFRVTNSTCKGRLYFNNQSQMCKKEASCEVRWGWPTAGWPRG